MLGSESKQKSPEEEKEGAYLLDIMLKSVPRPSFVSSDIGDLVIIFSRASGESHSIYSYNIVTVNRIRKELEGWVTHLQKNNLLKRVPGIGNRPPRKGSLWSRCVVPEEPRRGE